MRSSKVGAGCGHDCLRAETCFLKVCAFGMDSELLLEKYCCRTHKSKFGMKPGNLDGDVGPVAFDHLQHSQRSPRSAYFHFTGDSNFMAISSPLVLVVNVD